ncbi:hypothetical protein GF377_02470 [candidate division GN15 bacterium]|nr:hypothetical protein [candidate division GN15 bacterium]
MRLVVCLLLLSIALASLAASTHAQFPLIYTTNLPATARAHAMAESGVSIVDFGLQGANPATIGLVAVDNRAVVSFTPMYGRPYNEFIEDYTTLQFGGMAGIPLAATAKTPRLIAGIAYSYTRSETPTLIGYWDRTEEAMNQHRVTTSLARSGMLEMAAGVSVVINDFDQNTGTSGVSGGGTSVNYDVGAIVRYHGFRASDDHVRVVPAIGLSYLGAGSDFDFASSVCPSCEETFPLEERFKAGASVALEYPHTDFGSTVILVSADFESSKMGRSEDTLYRLGAEFGVTGILTGRVGFVAQDGLKPVNTWGVGAVPTAWVRKMARVDEIPENNNALWQQLDLKVEYSRYEDTGESPFSRGNWLNVTILWRR